MRLSYSSISTYQNCPLSYKFRYVDRLPTKRTPQLSYGTSLHAILAYFYDVSDSAPCSLDELLEHFPKVWESQGYSDSSEEQTYFEHAKEVLTQFYHTNIEDFQIPIALEHRFEIDLESCTLSGIIDRVDQLPNKNCEIIDYKTSRKLPPKSRVHQDLQLSVYYLACQEVWDMEPEKLSLYFLIPNLKMSTQRTEDDVKKTKSLIADVCDSIEAKRFQPRQNALCPWCDFQPYCPNYRHEFPNTDSALVPETPKEAPTEIENIVSEFISIKEETRDKSGRLDELKEIIHTYCQEQNLNSLSSEKGTIIRSKRVTQSYHVDKLQEILEPLGLWEQIITVDCGLLKQLINSEQTTAELKERVKSLAQIEDTSYALHVKKDSASISREESQNQEETI